MARKKIKFALKMKDGAEARTLRELKEAFDLNQIVAYFLDGKLETWLLDRYYEEIAKKISNLDKSDPKLKRRLCEIFGVEYEEDSLSIEEIEERNEKIKKLKEITDEEEVIRNVDKVAFSQEELADLLDEGETTIYLCGTDFYIPISKKGITYIGIKTKLDITQEERGQYQANDIELIGLLKDSLVDKELATNLTGNSINSNSDDNAVVDEELLTIRFDKFILNGKPIHFEKMEHYTRQIEDLIYISETHFINNDCGIFKLNDKEAKVFDYIYDGDVIEIQDNPLKIGNQNRNQELEYFNLNGRYIHLPNLGFLYSVSQLFPLLNCELMDGKYRIKINSKKASLRDKVYDGDVVEIVRVADI